jgi:UDP-3-O-[3-hydroxymyristoyl] glucosamine N-acyltransferase
MLPKYSLKLLAELTGARLVGNPDHEITGVEVLETASSQEASFLSNAAYRPFLEKTEAGLVCVSEETALIAGKNFLISADPSVTFQQIVQLILSKTFTGSGFTGIHPTAVIHPTAKIGKDVQIGPYVVVDQHCSIGDRTQIGPYVSLGPQVSIGSDCFFHPHVVIKDRSVIGNRVILQPGCVIGSCGFGYVTNNKGQHIKQEQLGVVVIEDDVEIGANTTIDRARFKETRISQGTKIDNLVQIGHNVIIGRHNLIVSQTGIAGSVRTGRHVVMGGQTGVVGHLEIGDEVMIAARGGIKKSMPKKGKYGGNPAIDLDEHQRQQVQLRNISSHVKRIGELEKKLSELEKKLC